LIIELKEGKFTLPKIMSVPKTRELKKFQGSFESIKAKLKDYQPEYPLQSFVELEIVEKDFSASVIAEVENLISEYSTSEKFTILKSKTTFENGAKDTSDLFQRGESIEDLKPLDVFDKLLENETLSEDRKDMVTDAFLELLESIHHTDPS
jgi:exonuclease SbcD